MKEPLIIGIDPGTTTGLSVWDRSKGELVEVTSGGILEMIQLLESYIEQGIKKVRIEDARKRTWFGNSGRGVLQGAGSIKRDCKIWVEACELFCLDYELVHPKNNMTKLDAKTFKQMTGWEGRTNEHKRDSAMLVYGI